jgi:hypothetical protein
MLRESRRFAAFLVYTVAFLLALRAFAGAAPQERELRGRVLLHGEPLGGATVRLYESDRVDRR